MLIDTSSAIAACQMNRHIDLKDFPIYAILTDSFNWHFIAYDGAQNQFFLDEAITIPDRAGSDGLLYLRAMINSEFSYYFCCANPSDYFQSVTESSACSYKAL